jgi:hypothetical protein
MIDIDYHHTNDNKLMQTADINFLACFGDIDKEVDLKYLKGGYYHIYIDRFYYGQIIKINDIWTFAPQNEGSLSSDDKDAILDRINE